ncbi:kinase-like domain-containing protein [Chlamydoabsidia padenii]|nr:kinase-like domain-containing protein [Chlamydoabsidia padenii]
MNFQDDISSFKISQNSMDNHSINDKKNDHLVQGPDGNNILCDSPPSLHLPVYTGPDQSITLAKAGQEGETSCTPSPSSSTQRRSVRRMKPRRVIGNYSLVTTLGSGSMGKVRLAINELNQDKLAVKIVPRVGTLERTTTNDTDEAKKKREKDLQREIRTIREASIMLLLHHPYIVSLKEMVVLDPYYYMFMEYVDGGQLLDFLISHGRLKERLARRFARQIVSALDYCHRNSIVHRDLKIENILISRNGHIKIIDFGLSNLFSPRSHLSTFCGSLYFAAPELLNAKAYTGPEVDVWSFGVVLYVLVCGKVPFDDQNMAALHDKIKRGVVDYPSHLTSECKNILSRMLVVNPNHRATTAEITVHPWMNKGHTEPVNNYLPERAPLTLPLDMQVVRGMTGFEFGSEQDIKQQLEDIIQSDDYQKAMATLVERQSYRHHRSRRHASFCLPNDDPQSIPAAYHPLISIYYLVKEHMERENQLQNDDTSYLMTTTLSKQRQRSISPRCREASAHQPPIIPMPEAAYASEIPKNGSSFDDGEKEKVTIRVDPHHDHGFGRLFNWHHHRRSDEGVNTLQQLTQVVTRSSFEKRHRRHTIDDKTVGNISNLVPSSELSGDNDGPKRLGRTFSKLLTRKSMPPHQDSTHHVHEQTFPGTQQQGTADEQVKPVFLKGLFSVSTTSTKHPSVIRADLIRVLERIGVKWRESKSRFECVHVPSIDMNRVNDPNALSTVTVPDLVVRFDISIVKVPWLLGMNGLQFRRVSGDTWQYKNMCSRILAELKL